MANLIRRAPPRDNSYFIARLKKAGRADLLALIEAGEMTVYAAAKDAGFRKKRHSNGFTSLVHAWERASFEERARFCGQKWIEMNAACGRTLELLNEWKKRHADAATQIERTTDDPIVDEECGASAPSAA